MTDQQGQSILLFFHMSFLNPRLADQGSHQVYKAFQKHLEKSRNAGAAADFENFFVKASHETYHRIRKTLSASPGALSTGSGLVKELSVVELSPWRDFVRSTPADEILIVIWNHILKIPLNVISKSLGISEGTLNHRLSRSIKKLGAKLDALSPSSVSSKGRT